MKKTFSAIKFGQPDSSGDIFSSNCKINKGIVLLSHNFSDPKIILPQGDCFIDENQLKFSHEIPENLMNGTPAIGFQPIKYEKNESGGRTFHEIKLYEISLVIPPQGAISTVKPLKDQNA